MFRTYDTGAEDITYLDPEPEIGESRDREDALPIPVGPVHAIDEEDKVACGYPDRLMRLGIPWPQGLISERCEACLDAVSR